MKSRIPLETLKAYREALYQVKAAPKAWTLRVGRRSARLLSLYRQESVSTAAFLTAHNPRGKKATKSVNESAQRRLIEDIRKKGFSFIPGVGKDPQGEWEGETSLLVLGLSLKDANSLGNKYRQNAVVFAGKKAVPRLVLLR